ncbi:NPCBM/NEW2 domain-containing protein [Streptomyces collinus]
MRLGESSWVWRRYGMSVARTRYAGGVTVHGRSSVTVDLNRPCTAYDALVGVDDLTLGLGRVTFSVYADGVRLWRSGPVAGHDEAVPVHVDLAGRRTVRLVEGRGHRLAPRAGYAGAAARRAGGRSSWLAARVSCRRGHRPVSRGRRTGRESVGRTPRGRRRAPGR